MVNTCSLKIVSTLLLSLAWANQALAENVVCPSSISVKESLDHPAPDGWATQFDNSARYLAGVTFFDGDPKENQSIAPTRDAPSSGTNRTAVWRFGSSGVPVWLACQYLGTGISLSRQLPSFYKECQVVYGPGAIIKSVSCK